MIRINDRYYITIDTYNIVLFEEKIVEDKRKKNYGEKTTRTIGYYNSFKGLLKALQNYNIMADSENIRSLSGLERKFDKFTQEITENTLNDVIDQMKKIIAEGKKK